MGTPAIILTMVAAAAVLFLGAFIMDRRMQQRMERRRKLEELGLAPKDKRDAADSLIEMLNQTGEMVRRSLEAARDDVEDKK